MRAKPDISKRDHGMAEMMLARANAGWYIGDMPTLRAYAQKADVIGRTEPSLQIRLLLSKDKMHHSVGWWRNAEYEFCWHLSMSAWDRSGNPMPEDIPPDEIRYWSFAFFPNEVLVLHLLGGSKPRVRTTRLVVDPETFQPFIPTGEVYDLTRWISGLTPEKVDR